MKINKDLILQNNSFLPATAYQILLIRIIYNKTYMLNEDNAVTVSFKEIKSYFSTDVRQKQINGLLNNIMKMRFFYNGCYYPYLNFYINDNEKRIYTFYLPHSTVSVWLENSVTYDINELFKLKANKTAIVLYEYFITDEEFLPYEKFYDIVGSDGYDIYDRIRALYKAINKINEQTKFNITIKHLSIGFVIEYN